MQAESTRYLDQQRWNEGHISYELKKIKGEDPANDPANNQNPGPGNNPPPVNRDNANKAWYQKLKEGAIRVFLLPIAAGLSENWQIYLTVGAIALTLILLLGSSLAAIGACSLSFAFFGLPLIGLGMLAIPVAILCILSYSTGIYDDIPLDQ